MKKAIVLFSLLLSVSGFAQTDVSGYVPGKSQDAVTYFLPKTIIEVEVEATKVTYTPGEFCKYADRNLRPGKFLLGNQQSNSQTRRYARS